MADRLRVLSDGIVEPKIAVSRGKGRPFKMHIVTTALLMIASVLAQDGAPADLAAKLSGAWKLNRELNPSISVPGRSGGRGGATPATPHAGQSPPVPMFDGQTFQGWEGDLKIFRIEDGAIVGGSLRDKVARNEFLCTTKTYGDFELRLKVKLVGEGANAGVQFRTKRIPNNHEVSGYQADMGTGWWGALYDESRRNKVLTGPDQATMKAVVKSGEWNDYVIRAEGKHIRLWLNGVQTVDYTEEEPGMDAAGVIAVQIHGGPPSEAWYKDITIVELGGK